MRKAQIAAQLFTLREHCKTPADIAATLKRVRAIGYEAVQVSGIGPIEPADLRRILDGEGLIACATHEGGDMLLDRTEQAMDKLRALGCKMTAYPYPGGVDLTVLEQVQTLARRLDEAGRKFAAAGMTLAYHNHAVEFTRLQGKTALEWILETAAPAHLQAELDTYWVQHGGADPLRWCARLQGRLPLIHLKDYTVLNGRPAYAPVGSGNLDMRAIVQTAESSGCRWFIVEQDDCYGESPFDCLAASFRYLAALASG
jgi:sugar phosphate isomerase/epimerase